MSIKKLLILSAAGLTAVASAVAFAGGPDAMSGPVAAAPAPVSDWTGIYAGGNLGGAMGMAPTNMSISGSGVTAAQVSSYNAANTNKFNVNSAILGAQLGYDYEIYDFVVGLETNFDYMSQNAAKTTSSTTSNANSFTGANSVQTNWFYTLRPRLGYSLNEDTVMVYATGGLAAANLTYTNATTESPGGVASNGPQEQASALLGWTAGGGVEWKFVPNWSLQGQYLYADLGNMHQAFNGSGTTEYQTQSASLTENVVTAGINYHF